MKKVILSVLALGILGIAMNAQANVKGKKPNAVLHAFNKMFPKAVDILAEQDEKEHVFFFNEKEVSKYCRLDAKGKWLEKGEAVAELPEELTEAIQAKYDNPELSEQYAVVTKNKQKAFLILFFTDNEYIEVLMDVNGEVLRERFLPTDENPEEKEEEDNGEEEEDDGK